MALTYSQNKYTIPRGRVFFSPINTATDEYLGELYMGNCPSLGLSIETEKPSTTAPKPACAKKTPAWCWRSSAPAASPATT